MIQQELNQFYIFRFQLPYKFTGKDAVFPAKKHIFVAGRHLLREKTDIPEIIRHYLRTYYMINSAMKTAFALLGTLLLLAACNGQSGQTAQHPAATLTADTTTHVQIPEWMQGTWSGKFDVDTQNSDYKILVTLLIDASGKVIQTSSDNSSPVEMLIGQCTGIDSRIMTVQFNDDTGNTEYLLDHKNKRIAIGNNTWLNKNDE